MSVDEWSVRRAKGEGGAAQAAPPEPTTSTTNLSHLPRRLPSAKLSGAAAGELCKVQLASPKRWRQRVPQFSPSPFFPSIPGALEEERGLARVPAVRLQEHQGAPFHAGKGAPPGCCHLAAAAWLVPMAAAATWRAPPPPPPPLLCRPGAAARRSGRASACAWSATPSPSAPTATPTSRRPRSTRRSAGRCVWYCVVGGTARL